MSALHGALARVSFLATADEPWRSIFNISTMLYGALCLVLPADPLRLLC